jgi:formate dehydrogenase major subunit
MTLRRLLDAWPVMRQMRGGDALGRGSANRSARSASLASRLRAADDIARSVCPFCAVGCGQLVHTADDRVLHIEGDPDSPVSGGKLCPKGAASTQLVTSAERVTTVRYRRSGGADWEDLDLEVAMDMIADRVLAARESGWQEHDEHGNRVRRTIGLASLGGATLDNEENYLWKKLWTAMGAVQIENQARI